MGNNLIKCMHCGNTSRSDIKAEYKYIDSVGRPPHTDEFFTLWQISLCPKCNKPSLFETKWDTFNLDPETGYQSTTNILYPVVTSSSSDLPEVICKSYEAALSVKNIEPNAFAVLIGRTLEFICEDKKAEGKTLNDKIDYLSTHHIIPGILAEIAHKLRALRNIGAHANPSDEITENDVPILLEFTDSLLDYIYRLPAKIEEVKNRINRR